jgi:hypothetical protein
MSSFEAVFSRIASLSTHGPELSAKPQSRLDFLTEWRTTKECSMEWHVCIGSAWHALRKLADHGLVESRIAEKTKRMGGIAREWRQRAKD